jgi:catechol 2,3-dioxygenase-like lactoylglutathione lyase family enzyme
MYDHIGLKVKNLDASVSFYRGALAALGHELASRDENGAGFGKSGATLWLYLDGKSKGCDVHVAFRGRIRADVDAFYREGLKAGGRDNGPPGVRTDYSPAYYAAFLLDPDGNNVEAVCME